MSVVEVTNELRCLLSGRVAVADGLVPPLVFVVADTVWAIPTAAALGLVSALGIVGWRLAGRKPLRFALAGLGGVVLATVIALRSGSAADYFLPGIATGAATTVAAALSIVLKRPLVAWSSWFSRGWPLDWYWHPRVRPAYSRATWLWVAFFGVRSLVQWHLYEGGETLLLGAARLIMGWPSLLILLVATYVLGRRWLQALGGPSVDEFERRSGRPWKGQATGF